MDLENGKEEIKPQPRKHGRKSSFFRKSFGASCAFSEFSDQATTMRSTGLTFSSESTDEISDRNIILLKDQKRLFKELLRELKNEYVLAKAESLTDAIGLEKECLIKKDLDFINAAPEYNSLFAKFEELKEKMTVETRLDAVLEEAASNFVDAVQAKVNDSVSNVVQKLAAERLTLADVLTPKLRIDSDGLLMPPFLTTPSNRTGEIDVSLVSSFDLQI